MNRMRIVAVVFASAWSLSSVAHGQLYWLDFNSPNDRLQRSNLDGTEIVTLIEEETITSFALDVDAGHIYWAQGAVPNGRIMRSDLDGSNPVELAESGTTTSAIALDLAHGKMYWTDFAIGKIQRANLDGSKVELLDTTELHVNDIDLDVAAGRMYYTVTSPDGVRRANLGAQSPVTLVSGQLALGIALDLAGGKLYFSASGLLRANLDGTDLETVANEPADGIALDVTAGHIYWADLVNGKIRRASLNGQDVQDIVTGLNNPREVAVRAAAPGDFDGDGDVDLFDYSTFSLCLDGPDNPPAPVCPIGDSADLNGDGHAELGDFAILARNFTD